MITASNGKFKTFGSFILVMSALFKIESVT
jgi:hypothetical protein